MLKEELPSEGCEQRADILSEVFRSRHRKSRRAKTPLLQNKDTAGGKEDEE